MSLDADPVSVTTSWYDIVHIPQRDMTRQGLKLLRQVAACAWLAWRGDLEAYASGLMGLGSDCRWVAYVGTGCSLRVSGSRETCRHFDTLLHSLHHYWLASEGGRRLFASKSIFPLITY